MEEVEPGLNMDASQLKAEGNEFFKNGQFDKALATYTKALNISEGKVASSDEKAAIHKNKAACFLKLDNPQNAAAEASKGENRFTWALDSTKICQLSCITGLFLSIYFLEVLVLLHMELLFF